MMPLALAVVTGVAVVTCFSPGDGWTPLHNLTASGQLVTVGVTVAADWRLHPAGTWLAIDGYGLRQVQDKGSAVKGEVLDVYQPTVARARVCGRTRRAYNRVGWSKPGAPFPAARLWAGRVE